MYKFDLIKTCVIYIRVSSERQVKQLTAEQGVTEELKEKAPMQWVGLMNNIRSQAEEVILRELIYN